MSMNQGRAIKTETGWRFGTTLQGVFYGLGYCSQCDGHDTPQDAMAHYQQFLQDKAAVSLVRAHADAEDDDMDSLGAALRAQPGQPDQRRCIVCGAVYDLNPERNAGIQSWRCDSCQEKVAAEADEEVATERQRKYRAMADTLWIDCGVPRNYQHESLDTYDLAGMPAALKKAHAAAVKWAQDFDMETAAGKRGLLLLGTVGVGKTHLACGVLRAVVDKLVPSREAILQRLRLEREIVLSSTGYDDTVGAQQFYRGPRFPIERYSVTFAVAPELVNQLVEARFHRNGNASEEEIYNRVISTRLLVLDDLGRVTRQSQVAQQQEVWYRIFNGRYNNRLPMIVTTNKSLEELNEIVGEAVADRMVEMFDAKDMTGDSYRGKKRRA